MECIFCNKVITNIGSLRVHEKYYCKQNANRKNKVSNLLQYNKKVKNAEIEKKYTNQYTKAKELCLPKPEISKETRNKIGLANRRKKWDKEKRLRHSEIMNKVVLLNSDSYTKKNVVGRVKNIEYNGTILKGSWEVEVAKWLDNNNIKWTNEIKPFEYFWSGSNHLYYPDFYLVDYNVYIEVKGYERERDRAKWSVMNNLIVIKEKQIKEIKSGTYRLSLITS